MNGYDKIKLPDNIEDLTMKALEKGDTDKRKPTIVKRKFTIAASLALLVLLGTVTYASGYMRNVYDWIAAKTVSQLKIHEFSGLFSYSFKFSSNKGDFTRYTMQKGDKLQHIYVTNEGKRLELYDVTDDEVILIYKGMLKSSESEKGEYFDKKPNEHIVLLKQPIETGTTWDNCKIVDTSALLNNKIPTNESEVIQVERKTDNQIEEFYYVKTFGLIKYQCINKSSGAIIDEFELKEFKELTN